MERGGGKWRGMEGNGRGPAQYVVSGSNGGGDEPRCLTTSTPTLNIHKYAFWTIYLTLLGRVLKLWVLVTVTVTVPVVRSYVWYHVRTVWYMRKGENSTVGGVTMVRERYMEDAKSTPTCRRTVAVPGVRRCTIAPLLLFLAVVSLVALSALTPNSLVHPQGHRKNGSCLQTGLRVPWRWALGELSAAPSILTMPNTTPTSIFAHI